MTRVYRDTNKGYTEPCDRVVGINGIPDSYLKELPHDLRLGDYCVEDAGHSRVIYEGLLTYMYVFSTPKGVPAKISQFVRILWINFINRISKSFIKITCARTINFASVE